MLYVGIDQHRQQLSVSVRDESGNVILRRQVSTEWKKVRALFDELRELASAHGGYLSVVEICDFNEWLLKLLPENGCRNTIVVQPGEQSSHKTDRRDASGLSEILWINRDRISRNLPVRGLRRIQVAGPGEQADRRLASRIGDIRRFKHPRSLANYWGLDPGSRNSGEAKQRLGGITKQGSALARFLLGQLVLHVLRKDSWMRTWFRGTKRRRGSKIARVAVMRRMATILWHMVTRNEPYLYGGPPPNAPGEPCCRRSYMNGV